MRELVTVETFPVSGRGVAHSVHVGDVPPGLGEQVLLDGNVCWVVGVEWPISRAGYTAIVVEGVSDGGT